MSETTPGETPVERRLREWTTTKTAGVLRGRITTRQPQPEDTRTDSGALLALCEETPR